MIDTEILESKFARIGARLKLADGLRRRRWNSSSGQVVFDIQSDHRGEYFEVIGQRDAEVEVEVLDVQPADRHLLILVREAGEKHKFLCGHDERHGSSPPYPSLPPSGL